MNNLYRDLAPVTEEESSWILRGAWEVALKGGRTQLALLLKGSKNKDLLKHRLEEAPAYGKLSLLTIPEIENRIDQAIRQGFVDVTRQGDFPLIVLTPEGWSDVRPWAHREEVRRAGQRPHAQWNRYDVEQGGPTHNRLF